MDANRRLGLRWLLWAVLAVGASIVAQRLVDWQTSPGTAGRVWGTAVVLVLLLGVFMWGVVYLIREGLRGKIPPRSR